MLYRVSVYNLGTYPQTCLTCDNSEGSYDCTCRAGFEPNDSNTNCTDIDECLLNNGGCNQVFLSTFKNEVIKIERKVIGASCSIIFNHSMLNIKVKFLWLQLMLHKLPYKFHSINSINSIKKF